MKSLQTKIMSLSMLCVVVSILTSTVIGLIIIRQVLTNDTEQIMELTCDQEAAQLNNMLDNMSHSVMAVNYYATSSIHNNPAILTDYEQFETYRDQAAVVAKNEAENTEGVMAVYLRFLPEYYGNTTGFFLTKLKDSQEFSPTEITDFSQYEKDDAEHVGWFYPIVESGEPMWLDPYYNANIDVQMISYVTPVIIDGRTIGVVGMDIDMDMLFDTTKGMQVYETGRGFLVDRSGMPIFKTSVVEGHDVTIFNKQIARIVGEDTGVDDEEIYSYHWGSEKWYLITRHLRNNMRLALTVEDSVAKAPERKLLKVLAFAIVLLLGFSFIMTRFTTRVIIRPIWQLTHAANKIAKGELDVKLDYEGNDEIGLLTKCFKETAKELKHYMDTMNELAYHDALTGALNKTAYEEQITKMDCNIKEKTAEFAVVVFDVNNLKKTNDTFGHEIGDKLILDAVRAMHNIFGNKCIYRIGGDEFAAILTGTELFTCKELLTAFDEEVHVIDAKEWVEYDISFQVARGLMVYEEGRDETFADVFRRADQCMYENKRYLKGMKVQ